MYATLAAYLISLKGADNRGLPQTLILFASCVFVLLVFGVCCQAILKTKRCLRHVVLSTVSEKVISEEVFSRTKDFSKFWNLQSVHGTYRYSHYRYFTYTVLIMIALRQ